MKKLLKGLLATVMALSLAACGTKEENKEPETPATIGAVKILCPTGAPGISLASVYEEVNKEGSITFVEGSDELVANLTKEDNFYLKALDDPNNTQITESISIKYHIY